MQDAAQPLTKLHDAIFEMTGAYCELVGCLGGDASDDRTQAVAA